jgi:dihydropteroate synthase
MAAMLWRCGDRTITYGERTLLMGIVNVTPDSFSDGGLWNEPERAVEHALALVVAGADILDVGGESTRPGSDPVAPEEELARVLPVISRLKGEASGVAVSIDTRRAAVAEESLRAGACIVNDVSAGRDPGMFDVVKDAGAGMVLMHMLGDPTTMQHEPSYTDVVSEVHGYLEERVAAAIAAGISRMSLAVDPGIGFGKNLEHNLALLASVDRFLDLGLPVVVGASRKRFIGELTDVSEPADRVDGTAGAVAWCAGAGVHVQRVHDVREMSRVAKVVDAIVRAR